MGFLPDSPVKTNNEILKKSNVEFLHRHGCQVCPLNRQTGLRHPHMPAHGSKEPVVYFLGEGPGKNEDALGRPFVGKAGQFLKSKIPDHWFDRIRRNNVVRTRPPENREPTEVEVECCRPSIVSDIEETKPQAIFGMGNVPLQWALRQHGIKRWIGRRIPVKIGSHVCWYFPMLHPSFVMRSENSKDEDGQDWTFVFENDLHNAFAAIEAGLPKPEVYTLETLQDDIEIVTDYKQAIELIESMHDEKIIGLDYETKRLRPYAKDSKILTVGMAGRDTAFAFPLHHSQNKWSESQLEKVEDCFERFLYEAPGKKVVHNLSFEMEWSAYFYGRKVLRAGLWEDTQSQAYILDERMGCHSLEFLAIQYLGFDVKDVYGYLDKDNLDKEPLDKVLQYNALDARTHRLIYFPQSKRLQDEGLTDVYKHQLRRIPTMALTQLKGVPIDQNVVNQFDKEHEVKLKEIEDKIAELNIVKKFHKVKKADFRPSSNQDVKFAIVNFLHQDVANVDEKVLSKIDHPLAKLVLEYRGTSKSWSTYIKPLKTGAPTLWPDGRIHPNISTGRTRTNRTSSDDPNEQNYPKHGEGRKLRKQMSGGGDLKFVAFDYSGIQARNVAMESKDKALVDAFWAGYDIHKDWCQIIADLWPKWLDGGSLKDPEVFKIKRQDAKNLFVFPSFFGAHPPNISNGLGIPLQKGEEAQELFWARFPQIRDWHKRLKRDYYKTGYVTGLSGFRRRAPISPNQLINSPIQADEAIIVCSAMAALSEMELTRFQANIEIHDDLTFVWPKNDIDANMEIVVKEMTKIRFSWINVPLGVEVSVGDNWCDLKEVAKFSSIEIWGHKRK